ncbi:hypothetical protein B0H67DRAFT_580627 [Lasiosphaeris hirsuta]|uniref:Uncharacterized protein n=1 Tax=Lasiosphaeris hirsuta TaxID=260670 RepID=A0AA40DVV1_9PEZI|nr:hypothetical protein B0H67DRAFT_580627 [Lasiosphaeris hirsuta]
MVLPYWLAVLIGVGTVAHLVMVGLGVWQLTRRGPKFVWAAPVPFNLIVPRLQLLLVRASLRSWLWS